MQADSAPLISIVIPCYNEEDNIASLFERCNAVLESYKPMGVELVMVDDGSIDNTWQRISQLCALHPFVCGIRLSRNFGHQMALACGFEHARGKRILVIDADLQDPPELLPDMMRKMDEGFDVVYGQRIERQSEKPFKKISSWLFYRVIKRLSETPIPVDTGEFRLMERKVLLALCAMPERVRFTRGLVGWLGFKQTALQYKRMGRQAGKTHYTLASMLRLANEGIVSFSTVPLQLATWMGMAMMVISVLLLGYVFCSWLFWHTVRGWTSLASIFLMSQACLWLFLGIMGKYISVIFHEAKGRPLFIVSEVMNAPKT